jgi:segregation and condensation protein A
MLSNKQLKPESQKLVIEKKINSVVKRRIYSVMTKVVHVLRELYSSGQIYMDSLYEGVTDRSERVATFLAVLELTRHGRIGISDDNLIVFFKGRKDGERKSWKSKKNSEQ